MRCGIQLGFGSYCALPPEHEGNHVSAKSPTQWLPEVKRSREDALYADLTAAFARILATPREPADAAAQLTQLLRLEFDIARRVIK